MTYISLAFSLWSAKDYIVDFFIGLKKATEIRKEKKRLKKQAKAKKREDKLKLFNRTKI